MKRREEIGRQRWSAIVRQVRAGKLDYLLPIYGTRSQIGLAVWNETYANLCRYGGLAEEAPNIGPNEDSGRERQADASDKNDDAPNLIETGKRLLQEAKSEHGRKAIAGYLLHLSAIKGIIGEDLMRDMEARLDAANLAPDEFIRFAVRTLVHELNLTNTREFSQITTHLQTVARVMLRCAKSEKEKAAITFWIEKFNRAKRSARKHEEHKTNA